MTESRLTTIDGRPVRVIERQKPIPPTLELFLNGGRDATGRPWSPLRVISRRNLRLGGSTSLCASHDHRMSPWLDGFHTGSDAIVRSVRVLICDDCGATCVRDVSFDRLPGVNAGRLAPRRRDLILGWYTGSRPRQRQYT